MSPIVGITPAFTNYRIEEFTKQMVRVERTRLLRFQHARTLKFGEALEFVSRQTTQKIYNYMSVSGGGGAKKSTYQRRARGDNGQI